MAADAAAAREFAPAKVNLFLHVRGRRADGYHLLESLAVFPRIGDVLDWRPDPALSLAFGGPFGGALASEADNLVLRAARGMGATGALTLTKALPVASGIGGGSADAAAALRLLARVTGRAVPEGLAASLGADVPVCLAPATRLMAGIGERLTHGPRHPAFWMLLVNPGVAVPTGPVFAGLASRDNQAGPDAPAAGFADFAAFTDWLAHQRNDLEAPARALAPVIGTVLDALATAPLARMSGSGATCFAIHPDEAAARAQAARLPRDWWHAVAPVAAHP